MNREVWCVWLVLYHVYSSWYVVGIFLELVTFVEFIACVNRGVKNHLFYQHLVLHGDVG